MTSLTNHEELIQNVLAKKKPLKLCLESLVNPTGPQPEVRHWVGLEREELFGKGSSVLIFWLQDMLRKCFLLTKDFLYFTLAYWSLQKAEAMASVSFHPVCSDFFAFVQILACTQGQAKKARLQLHSLYLFVRDFPPFSFPGLFLPLSNTVSGPL